MRMRTKCKRWQRKELESAWASDNFIKCHKQSYLSHCPLKMLCYVQPILILTRMLAHWSDTSPALLSPCWRSRHCPDREYPPPCLYLFKSCPSSGGWIKSHLPHETPLPLPPLNSGAACLPPLLGHLASAAFTVIHPCTRIPWILKEAQDHQGQGPQFPRPCILWARETFHARHWMPGPVGSGPRKSLSLPPAARFRMKPEGM